VQDVFVAHLAKFASFCSDELGGVLSTESYSLKLGGLFAGKKLLLLREPDFVEGSNAGGLREGVPVFFDM
jgi:hypothetical protein